MIVAFRSRERALVGQQEASKPEPPCNPPAPAIAPDFFRSRTKLLFTPLPPTATNTERLPP